MATVRTGNSPTRTRDIGPAAAHTEGLNAIAHLSALPRAEGLLVDLSQDAGAGPVERRYVTCRCGCHPGAAHPCVHCEGHPEHVTPQSVLATAAPLYIGGPPRSRPAATTAPEEVVVPAIPDPPAIPCGTCLHARVCRDRENVEHTDPTGVVEVRPGLRMLITRTHECDDHLAAVIPVREPLITSIVSAGEITQKSRQRGAEHLRKATDEQLIEALRAAGGNVDAAARQLGMAGPSVRSRARALIARERMPEDVAATLISRPQRSRRAQPVPA
jgi:hypothetical protein